MNMLNKTYYPSRDFEFEEIKDSLDKGIKHYVEVLVAEGIETYQSCEGGEGHPFPEPTVQFYGLRPEGFRALAIALQNGLPVKALCRVWRIVAEEPVGPNWEMVFWKQ